MARGAPAAPELAGGRAPQDVAVGSFDDFAAASRPALLPIRQPWDRVSSELVRVLLNRIDGEPPSTELLPTELVLRETA
ncbi:hypothetical protein GCM10009716_29080 [Streptomyces sodiiphilus]|uniref:Transcriptional regulator LacI/GalR-like sensor domain-containing protein n=2 Tax=Streptomyces sodiiphilus TaxID=226217 RepID=A0ABN2PCR7_9ACTN